MGVVYQVGGRRGRGEVLGEKVSDWEEKGGTGNRPLGLKDAGGGGTPERCSVVRGVYVRQTGQEGGGM